MSDTHSAPPVRVYLRPEGILAGAAAQTAAQSGKARRLAGGPLAYTMAEIIVREQSGVRQTNVRRPTVLKRSIVAADELETWRDHGDADLKGQLRRLIERIEQPRPCAGEPRLMGVVNVTPDSFSDGGLFLDPTNALAHCESLLAAGAHILDIGGESTRPGALPVAPEVELERVRPLLEALRTRRATMPGVELSIDTRHAEVMRFALATGADIVNDVTALTGDPASLAVAAASRASVVLMHMQGTPETMNVAPGYDDVVLDVYDYLEERIDACVAAGIGRERLIIDPGIGFGKRGAQSLELLRHVAVFHGLGCPLLLGVSRKGLGTAVQSLPPAERVPTSLAAAMHALSHGVQCLRVHDVAATRQVVELWRRLHGGHPSEM